jgi:hypothetical protein
MEDSAGILSGPAPMVEGDWLVSEIPGKPLAVRMSLDVVQRLGMAVREGFKSLPRRGLETGGLLIGRTRKASGKLLIDVADFEPVESEHATGPSYLLSDVDRRLLEARIAAREGKKGVSIVGFYRSHTRRNFAVTLEDSALFSSYFRKPNDFFLLIKSNDEGPPTCGLIFRENGKDLFGIPGAQFPLDLNAYALPPRETGVRAAAATVAFKATPIVPAAPPEPAVGNGAGEHYSPETAPGMQIPVAQPSVAQRPGIRSLALAAPAIPTPAALRALIPRTFALVRATPKVRLDSLLGKWPLWLVAAAVGLAISIPWSAQRRPDPVQQSLALNVANTGANLRLLWDHQASLRATHAILWITDGPQEHRFELDAKQLSQGSVSYWPTTSDVNFRLEWMSPTGKMIESVRAIGVTPVKSAALNPPAPAEPATSPAVPVADTVAVARRQTRSVTGSAQREISRKFVAPSTDTGAAANRTALPEPPALGLATAPPPDRSAKLLESIAPVKDSNSRDIADSSFGVEVQPVPHLARNIPLIGKRTPRADYAPPVPLHKSALLTLPHREVTHEVLIDVKVYVNPSGKVEYSELVSRVPKTESDLASLVVFSARRWEFEPAREGKDAVAGEVVLHYRFGPGGRASAR